MSASWNHSRLGQAAACVGLLTTAAAVHAQPLELYVDDDAPAGGDGLSWQTAFRDLQDAVDIAYQDAVANPSQRDRNIRIAGGSYVPGRGSLDRTSTFQLLSATSLIGGYAGWNAADPNLQDSTRFVTVLSGDVNGDDQPDFLNRSDNAFHVVTVYSGGSWSNLYSLTVRGGNATGSWPNDRGGGILCLDDGPGVAVTECMITDNGANYGGGIAGAWGYVWIIRSSVIANRAWVHGGGVYLKRGYAEGSRFIANEVLSVHQGRGGGMYIDGGNVQLVSTVLSGNDGKLFGGGIAAVGTVLDVVNCTFSANRASDGRAIHADGAMEAWIFSSIIARSGPANGELAAFWRAKFGLAGSIVEGDMHRYLLLSGVSFSEYGNLDTSPRFVDPLGVDGIAGTSDDNLRLRPGSTAIDRGYHYPPVAPGLLQSLDADGLPRLHDDLGIVNYRSGTEGALDIGAYEFQGTTCFADYDANGTVGVPDIFAYLADWFVQSPQADIDREGGVQITDLFDWLAAWFAGC